jgi:hypothetical protein
VRHTLVLSTILLVLQGPDPGPYRGIRGRQARGAELLVRAGHPKQMMIDTLTWLMQTSGSDSGGFFADHPGAGDRIEALRRP